MIKKKICMAGMYGVGKTSLVRRFVESIFDDRYLATVGVRIDKKTLDVGGRPVLLAIWDVAGEDELSGFRVSNLRGASGYLLVADGCRRASLGKAAELQRRITGLIGTVPFVLLLNKADLREEWEVRTEDLSDLAGSGWRIVETSAKTGDGVEEAFLSLAREMLA